MSLIDLVAHRQALQNAEDEALDMDESMLELHAINGDLADEDELLELARQVVYPPLFCVKARKIAQ
jgi:hypothetical protein